MTADTPSSDTTTPPPATSPERFARPWGWYETLAEMPGAKVKRIRVEAGQQLSLQKHHQRAEHWVVTQGVARVTLGDTCRDLLPGQHIDIALGEVHRLASPGPQATEIVEVQFGEYLGEDDIVRLEDVYGRA